MGDELVTGPNEKGAISGLDPQVRDKIASVRGLQMVVHENEYFVSSEEGLTAITADRQRKWQVPKVAIHALVMAGDTVIAGGDDLVAAYSAIDGQKLWEHRVDGQAHGLAVADGRLLVATDNGTLHSFAQPSSDTKDTVVEIRDKPAESQDDNESSPERQLATTLLEQVEATKGYCLVVDCGEGRLLEELARASQLRVIGVERDAVRVAVARERLQAAGLYGSRAVVHHVQSEYSPYQPATMNLIVCDPGEGESSAPSVSISHLLRLVRPCGGVLATANRAGQRHTWTDDAEFSWKSETIANQQWTIAARGELPGAGDWSHQYADAGNSANSGDARLRGPFEVQWFGPPGPQDMVDRHNRTSAPVFRDGRLFIPGDNHVLALDAYNGTVLWRKGIPDSLRLAVSKDCSHVVAGEQALYVAAGPSCLALDPRSGDLLRTSSIDSFSDGVPRRWGYVAYDDGVLFGSAVKDDPARRTLSPESWSAGYLDFARLVGSDALYGCDATSGERLWSYAPPAGVVINTTLGAADGRLYFVQSENPETFANPSGTLTLAELTARGATLVALDAQTGERIWSRPVELQSIHHTLFLTVTDGLVLLTGSKNEGAFLRYELFAFDAATGRDLWRVTPATGHGVGGSHGEQDQHPVVVGGVLYTKTFAVDLKRGAAHRDWQLPGGGCGTLSACPTGVFFRSGGPAMAELEGGHTQQLTKVTRPGCWINLIPAGGLVIAPESSSGCTCGYGLQTSLALAPVACPPPTIDVAAVSRAAGRVADVREDHFAGKLFCELHCEHEDAEVHYTTDGSWPGADAPLYREPIEINETCTVRGRAYLSEGRSSPVVQRTFTRTDVPRLVPSSPQLVVSARVEFERPFGSTVIRYTTDGTTPVLSSPVYREPLVLNESATVTAALFDAGERIGPDVAAEFERVEGRRPVVGGQFEQGLAYAYYEGDWEKLPDFDALTPLKNGVVDAITLDPALRRDDMGFQFRGYVEVAQDGLYTFYLLSDDGSRLEIGGETVVDNDGLHDARLEKSGRMALAAGKHEIVVSYFEDGSQEVLRVSYEGPQLGKQPLPASALFHAAPRTEAP